MNAETQRRREENAEEECRIMAKDANEPTPGREETGVDDVRRVREQIAREHNGDLAAHVAETNRIAEEIRRRYRLGPVVPPPSSGSKRSGTEG
jgi:cytosine/adenosine deaminase-related metal-dependent hydrolase